MFSDERHEGVEEFKLFFEEGAEDGFEGWICFGFFDDNVSEGVPEIVIDFFSCKVKSVILHILSDFFFELIKFFRKFYWG